MQITKQALAEMVSAEVRRQQKSASFSKKAAYNIFEWMELLKVQLKKLAREQQVNFNELMEYVANECNPMIAFQKRVGPMNYANKILVDFYSEGISFD